MTITKAEMKAIALDLMSGNNLMQRDLIAEGWSFEFSTRKAALGDCNYRTKVLRLSEVYLNARTKEEQINTITHEMAHAIAYTDFNERGHGAIWKRVHRQLGGTAERCSTVSNPEAVDSKYVVFFENAQGELEVVQKMDRMTKRFQPVHIKSLYLKGRKAETEGQLRCVSSATFKAIKADLEAKKADNAEAAKPVEPVAPKAKKTETPKPAKKVSARGQAARDAIAEIVMTTTHKGCKSVSFEQRGKYKDWYIMIELEAHTIEQRLDTFKKKHSL
ncbi:protein SprT [Vibrio phage TCU-VP03-AIR1]